MAQGHAPENGGSAPSTANATEPVNLSRALRLMIATALAVYVLLEVSIPILPPLAELAIFGGFGLVLCFLGGAPAEHRLARVCDGLLAVASAVCCGYLVVQSESLGQRAALYTTPDLVIGGLGMLLVLEAARRSVGWSLPILAVLFLLYAHESVARNLPDWLFPHRGQDLQAIVGQSWLRSEGVFGTAMGVMFRYVFLFVLFGAVLEAAGATGWVISVAQRIFGKRTGGPAKVAVLASGLMGSLSGSAVANAATTGTFTIPLMRSSGFSAVVAAGIEAAASSGGALVPPVMGAGAYMMLEIINRDPPVRFLEIVQAALIPAILYYLSIFLLVHFYARRIDVDRSGPQPSGVDGDVAPAPAQAIGLEDTPVFSLEGLTFVGALGGLMALLFAGFSPFRAVSVATCFAMAMILLNPRTGGTWLSRAAAAGWWIGLAALSRMMFPDHIGWGEAPMAGLAGLLVTLVAVSLFFPLWNGRMIALVKTTAIGGTPLVAAAACVGIIVGLVSRTGIGTGVPAAIIPLAGNSLFLALLAIMGCSLVLGMGLPSAVSYLLLATIIGPVFNDPALGVPILAAHLFIFYFGMMAMVTPPVALAAYATASIAGADVMRASLAAFRFSLVGFSLPYMFVYRPALCLMNHEGGPAAPLAVLGAVTGAVVGVTALAAGIAGYLNARLSWPQRLACFAAAACALAPDSLSIAGTGFSFVDLGGLILLVGVGLSCRRKAVVAA